MVRGCCWSGGRDHIPRIPLPVSCRDTARDSLTRVLPLDIPLIVIFGRGVFAATLPLSTGLRGTRPLSSLQSGDEDSVPLSTGGREGDVIYYQQNS